MSKTRLPNKTITTAYALMVTSGILIVCALMIAINIVRIITTSPALNTATVTPQEQALNQVIELLHGESLAD